MEKFFAEEEITEAELKTALRKACIACELMPVMCGSAYRNKGVQKLLDGVVEYMPHLQTFPQSRVLTLQQAKKQKDTHPTKSPSLLWYSK